MLKISAVIVIILVGLVQGKKLECHISYHDNSLVYVKVGHKTPCYLEKIDNSHFDVMLSPRKYDWLEYDPNKQIITVTPEKDDLGRSNISITISPKVCSTVRPWEVMVTFVIDLPSQLLSTDSCPSPPAVHRPVNHIQTKVGQVFRLDLDPMTFVDKEEGSLTELQISLKPLFTFDVANSFWLKLDETGLTLYGVPLMQDTVYVVSLVAMDSCNQTDVDSIRLELLENIEEYNHEFIIYFGDGNLADHDIYRFVNGLSQWLELTDPSQIYVTRVSSKSVSWVDLSMSSTMCERSRILDVYYQMGDENGTILDSFSCFFSPFFNVSDVYVDFKDSCNISDIFLIPEPGMVETSSSSDMYLLYILIPVAALTFIILLIIVVMLVRKCVKQNRYVMNSEKPIYLVNRQPVIFQNEYNEDETNLKPQTPIVIDNFDDPYAPMDKTYDRSVTNPPSYIHTPQRDPPQYRLPPPYTVP